MNEEKTLVSSLRLRPGRWAVTVRAMVAPVEGALTRIWIGFQSNILVFENLPVRNGLHLMEYEVEVFFRKLDKLELHSSGGCVLKGEIEAVPRAGAKDWTPVPGPVVAHWPEGGRG